MEQVGKLIWALPLAGMLLTACGGGGADAGAPSRQASNEIAVGEPHPAALNIADFTAVARDASCADTRNRLFIIDGAQVLWDRAGNCADASYSLTLYGNKPATVLCTQGDTIAGPRTTCQDESARKEFETIAAHLDESDLGLGSGHKVEQVAFLPKAGTAVAFSSVAASQFSGVTTRQNLVIRDLETWQKLWTQHASVQTPPPPTPRVDFTRQMLIAVFSDQAHDACYGLSIGAVTAGATKLVVEVDERGPRMGVMCAQIATNPMQVVAVDRIDAEAEFVVKRSVDLAASPLDTSSTSQVTTDRDVVARDAASFARLWAEHAGERVVVPDVDFTTSMVVGVFMGSQPNGCYATRVGAVTRVDDRIRVQRVDTVPAKGAVCTQAIVTPAQLVVVERSDAPVDFTLQVETLK